MPIRECIDANQIETMNEYREPIGLNCLLYTCLGALGYLVVHVGLHLFIPEGMNGTVEIKAVTLVVEGVDEWGDLKIDHRGDSVTISVWDRSDMEGSLRKYGAIRIHEEFDGHGRSRGTTWQPLKIPKKKQKPVRVPAQNIT